MNIKTEYGINEEVWFVHPGTMKVSSGKIIGIQISVKSKEVMKTGRVGRSLEKTGQFKEDSTTIVYTINSHIGPWAASGVQKRFTEIADNKETLIKKLKKQIDSL